MGDSKVRCEENSAKNYEGYDRNNYCLAVSSVSAGQGTFFNCLFDFCFDSNQICISIDSLGVAGIIFYSNKCTKPKENASMCRITDNICFDDVAGTC
jgi:hypothetical protein